MTFIHLCTVYCWATAFRSSAFHVRINTNNSLERQNRALEYDYLAAYRDTSLLGLVTKLLERFHPDKQDVIPSLGVI